MRNFNIVFHHIRTDEVSQALIANVNALGSSAFQYTQNAKGFYPVVVLARMALYWDGRTEDYLCPGRKGKGFGQLSLKSPWIGFPMAGDGTDKAGVDKNSWSRRMELEHKSLPPAAGACVHCHCQGGQSLMGVSVPGDSLSR
jgi:hypothetical protein